MEIIQILRNKNVEGKRLSMNETLQQALRTRIEDLASSAAVPGTVYASQRRGETVREGTVGFGHLEEEREIDQDTIFIGSITKSFTALSIMQLAERDVLAIDDPVVQWLPEFRIPNEKWRTEINLAHLMSHTSGLPPLPSLHTQWPRAFSKIRRWKNFRFRWTNRRSNPLTP